MMPSVPSNEQNQVLKSVSRNGSDVDETMISVKIYDSLLCELRCPSCARPLQAPIKLCETGHSICNWCNKMLAKCPLCSKAFTEIRSLTLEAISAKAQFRCTNSSLGCTVRLQLNLLEKHEERCTYQLGDCFMGKVWGGCKWHGREIDWIDHCELDHREKLFFGADVTRTWEFSRDRIPPPICGYFIFRVFGESFNLYQIYDKPKNLMCWTMICASKEPNVAKRFSFEIELFSPTDDSKISVQRNKCHNEKDAGILQEGQCAMYGLGEIMRFMDEYRILHYRIKVFENVQSKRSSLIRMSPISVNSARSQFFETDYSQTKIEGNNSKKIPHEKIITRQLQRNSNIWNQNGRSKMSSSPIEGCKNVADPKRVSPTSGVKNMLISSTTSAFKPLTSESRKNLSLPSTKAAGTQTTPSNPTTPSTPPLNLTTPSTPSPPLTPTTLPNSATTIPKQLNREMSWENIIDTDSIDNNIVENNNLKKIVVRSYNVDVKNIDDFVSRSTVSVNQANSLPKPPRSSLDKENHYEPPPLPKLNIQ